MATVDLIRFEPCRVHEHTSRMSIRGPVEQDGDGCPFPPPAPQVTHTNAPTTAPPLPYVIQGRWHPPPPLPSVRCLWRTATGLASWVATAGPCRGDPPLHAAPPHPSVQRRTAAFRANTRNLRNTRGGIMFHRSVWGDSWFVAFILPPPLWCAGSGVELCFAGGFGGCMSCCISYAPPPRVGSGLRLTSHPIPPPHSLDELLGQGLAVPR